MFVALFVTLQLVSGQFLEEEDEHDEAMRPAIVATAFAHGAGHEAGAPAGGKEDSLVMELHEAVGLAALAALVARLLWGLFGGAAEGSARRWFPWTGREGRQALIGDIRREVPMWFRGRLPEPSESDAIAKTVHGVMMLAALVAAAAGFGMWLLGDHEHGLGHDLAEAHEVFANGVLILVLGHVAMVIWHKLLGHRIAERILPWGRP
ncbi:MAG: cytochrome b/b6 domain-containing protein [Mariprofundaceae bacterium]